jgi:ribosome maturation factor RimP
LVESASESSPREAIREQIVTLCRPLLEADGFEFVDAEWSSGAGHKTLRLFIHRSGGVTIGECQRIHRMLMPMLSVEGIVDDHTAVEVGSPGLNRPLRRQSDFRRAEGYYVTVRRRIGEDPDREASFVGKLLSAESSLTMILDTGEQVEIPLDEVIEGRFDVRM